MTKTESVMYSLRGDRIDHGGTMVGDHTYVPHQLEHMCQCREKHDMEGTLGDVEALCHEVKVTWR